MNSDEGEWKKDIVVTPARVIPSEVTSGYSSVFWLLRRWQFLERKLNIAFYVPVDSEIFWEFLSFHKAFVLVHLNDHAW